MCVGGPGARVRREVDYRPLPHDKILECVRIPAGNGVRINKYARFSHTK
jgi:hypothetical protein